MDIELFLSDLEAQFSDTHVQERSLLIDELTAVERAGITLSARLSAAEGVLTCVLRGGDLVRGRVLDSTRTWVLLREAAADSLIFLPAIVAAWPLGASSTEEGSVRTGVGVGHILRALADMAQGIVIDSDAGSYQGNIDAVYHDHVDVSLRSDAVSFDSRDEQKEQVISLALSGLRRLRLLEKRWDNTY